MTILASTDWRQGIPGPSPVPVLGWLPGLLRFALAPLSTLEDLRRRYGDLLRAGNEKYPVIIVFSPEYNRVILRDPSVFYAYDLDLLPVPFPSESSLAHVTTGMPLMNGVRHDDQRSALLPYFHKKFITRYHDACVKVTRKKLSAWSEGTEVKLRPEMEQLAMWLAAAPVLGLDPERDGEAAGRQLERLMKLLFNPLTLLFPYDIPGFPFHSLLRRAEEMERVVRGIIQRKKAEGLREDDILSIMIRMHEENPERLNEEELIGHITTMFRGGYNPNGMVLYWSIFLLAQHPEIYKKVLAELASVLGDEDPANEQLESLHLLEGVIKETMRLFPAGTWTGRLAMKPFELGGYSLPKGTWVVMSPYITQRIPEIFPDPYKFMPERWASIHPTAYEFMPFSAGPRYCIGTSLGIMQLKIALSMLLRRFSYSLPSQTRVECAGLNAIRPQAGLPVILGPAGVIPSPSKISGNIHEIVRFD
jgi:cytochrome P450